MFVSPDAIQQRVNEKKVGEFAARPLLESLMKQPDGQLTFSSGSFMKQEADPIQSAMTAMRAQQPQQAIDQLLAEEKILTWILSISSGPELWRKWQVPASKGVE